MGPLELVRKIVQTGALLAKGGSETTSLSAVDAGLRAVETTTAVARKVRAGPLPEARGFERIALTAAAGQLRTMASLLGLERAVTAEPPPPPDGAGTEASPADPGRERALQGFVSPSEQGLLREEKEARLRAGLSELVAETLALVDAVLAVPPELEGKRRGWELPRRR
jgi:hypothetical protein